jgi:thiol-disulfide isomerase/thioredoxin
MRNIFLVALLFSFQFLFAQEKGFTVSGKVEGLDSKKMFVYFEDAKGTRVRDSIVVQNGFFTYSRKIEGVSMVSLTPNVDRIVKKAGRGYFPAKSSLFHFIASPGADVKFSGKITDFVDAYPQGDAANHDLARLNRKIYPLLNAAVNLQVKIANKILTDSVMIKEANVAIKEMDEAVVKIKTEFIQNNPSSVVSAWTLADLMLRTQIPNEAAIKWFEHLNKEELTGNPFYSEVFKRVEGIRATTAGKPAPEITTAHTYDGKPFTLASLKGKYVVLDFWGTWCGPCIAGMPRMKEYLAKYKDKLEIVGVAQESDDGTKWRAFLDKNPSYQWHHVLSRNDENYILKYSVAGFPTKIIIDPQGKILARFVGEDDAIYNKLNEILN